MKMSDTISEIAGALSRAQGMIDDASKASANPFFKSKYADLAAVRAVIREPLAVCDLAIIQAPRVVDGYASAITYARRIGIMSLLCLASYDDDGNTAVESVKAAAPKKVASKDVIAAGNAAASQGYNALTAWWNGLDEADRKSFPADERAKLRVISREADGSDVEAQ